jgi:hypothetical protein
MTAKQSLPSAYTGGHQLQPHSDSVLARKGWLKCVLCGREVHGTERAGGTWDPCMKKVKFLIMCQVSGGVTGFRQSPLKEDGQVRYFDTREEADTRAAHLNKEMNNVHSVADFKYWVEEVAS